MNKNNILVIEDSYLIGTLVEASLLEKGYDVTLERGGQNGIDAFLSNDFSLIILDLILPDIKGEKVLKTIRETSTIPIIIISAKNKDTDVALSLNLGADDYLKKPFSTLELYTRVNSLIISRNERNINTLEVINIGNLSVCLDNGEITKEGTEIYLSRNEFRIFEYFVRNKNQIVYKEQIYKILGNELNNSREQSVITYISHLRKKIEDDSRYPRFIITVKGGGYIFRG